MKVDTNTLYGTLYNKALEGDADCGGLLPYCYFSGEHITHFEEGRPLFARTPDSKFTLANFMRSHLFTSVGALKLGMDILLKEEGVVVDKILGHGGFFKTKGVGQKVMAAAVNAPVSVMETAGEAAPGESLFWLRTVKIRQKARALLLIWKNRYLQKKKVYRLHRIRRMWKDLKCLWTDIKRDWRLSVQQ